MKTTRIIGQTLILAGSISSPLPPPVKRMFEKPDMPNFRLGNAKADKTGIESAPLQQPAPPAPAATRETLAALAATVKLPPKPVPWGIRRFYEFRRPKRRKFRHT